VRRTLLAGFLIAFLFMCVLPVSANPSNAFSTLSPAHWSYDSMKELIQSGLVAGDVDRFKQGKTLSRYEMAILVANGNTRIADATAEQKQTLAKLTTEFGPELDKLGVAPKAPQTQKKLNIMIEQRLQYNYTSLGNTDGGKWPAGNVVDQDQFSERLRVYLDAPLGDKWHFNARFYQQKLNWGADTNNSSGGDTNGRFDRYYVTGKDILGGNLEVGKNFLYPGKGTFFGNLGDIDGVIYTAKMDKLKFRGAYAKLDFVTNGTAPAGALHLAEVSYKPTPTSDLGAYVLSHELSPGNKDIDLFSVNGAVQLSDKFSLSYEWARNNADGAAYHGKTGYIVALQSRYQNTWRMPPIYDGAVNPFKKGDAAWAISYRHMPAGVSGQFNRGANSIAPLSTDSLGGYQNNLNNVNAWRADYYCVPWNNVAWAVVYDRSKEIDNKFTNNSIQTAFIFLFK